MLKIVVFSKNKKNEEVKQKLDKPRTFSKGQLTLCYTNLQVIHTELISFLDALVVLQVIGAWAT
jgi:hypothetical protein